MQLPKEHITPKLESLQPDLRARADKIIAKKFNLKNTADSVLDKMVTFYSESSAKMKDMVFFANGQDSIQRFDGSSDMATLAAATVTRQRREGRIRQYNPEGLNTMHMDAQCGSCGKEICQTIGIGMITWTWLCKACGNESFVNLSGYLQRSDPRLNGQLIASPPMPTNPFW
jgi:ribosomal protein L37AE/L43A